MAIKLKKMTAGIKGMWGWFILAVLASDLVLMMDMAEVTGSGFVSDIVIYAALIILILACVILAVKIRSDDDEFRYFHLADRFRTDTLLVLICLVAIVICCLLGGISSAYNSWIWMNNGYSSPAYKIAVFVLLLPETFTGILCFTVLVGRFKNPEKRRELWIVTKLPKKKVKEKKVRIKKENFVRRINNSCQEKITAWKAGYEKAYDYEKKQMIRTVVFSGINILIIFGLLFSYPRFWMIVLLIVEIAFFIAQREFYHDVGQIIGELHHLSGGEEILPVAVAETSPLYEAACDLDKVNESLDLSVKRQMKSEQMKVDLITNVSHDLKTPLTSIIGYIDLLKKEEMSPEAQDYVSIISSKSEHLKEMIQDLFEISKATSGNAELVMEKLDMVRLLEQTLGDMEDRISSSGRAIRTDFPEEPLYISGDGRRLYRVYQNLIENALKYSLEGTRIFVEAKLEDQKVVTTIKNIAAYEMDFTPDKIVERFQRGDVNRTTEGHGLGLAIAKSFSEACGGQLDIVIDGDLFKSIIRYPMYREL